MQEFKIRCSAIGKIMTNARNKGETLSATCKTYVDEWLKEQIYGVRKDIYSKYLEKGNLCEPESIDLYADMIDVPFICKYDGGTIYTDFIIGTPDMILPDMVVDVKTSWDCFTFPRFETEIPNKDYWWQLQGYMAITGKEKAQLVYCLVNTPEHLLSPFDVDVDYSKLPLKDRVRVFDVERDNEAIESIKARVIEIRNYISTLEL